MPGLDDRYPGKICLSRLPGLRQCCLQWLNMKRLNLTEQSSLLSILTLFSVDIADELQRLAGMESQRTKGGAETRVQMEWSASHPIFNK
jgi:hypothetical protein